MTITDAKNARYNESGTITADVRFDDEIAPDGTPLYLPYTAAAHDPAPYGAQLYDDLVSGKYGSITSFTVTPEMLTAAKQAKHAEINAWRDAQENGSIIFTLNSHRWDCGKASQTRLAPVVAVAKSGALPPGFFWTDADNIDVPMTTDELAALEAAMQQNMVMQGFKIHERQRQMKEEVDKLTTIDDVRAYIPDWPPTTASTTDSTGAGK
ncbi:DUF4376 domain-containing protein [Salmonella enterica subsp. diarizonae]|uniref:DUF4376 domain-containing protein n=1 Tax=Salmonella enterica TaxID=28901 RepID=A0A3R0XN04_SALER|nr:DUF4376 domain-containing protein [Salmonella enterica]ECI2943339.1 DUF4376 domain-containing protein [Salmonella enterica subsp. diarizonae]ECI3369440.1 DUF4376 domain-containing protein [Salmonella enterica subsp. diarizonae]ECI4842246.1 DUF4376 domain-containing protein [Salmonella enterica subsp. diarizonae]ECK0669046.1 DUF4376 domain-containing protein [Salmonella enterica subsp. diarizonae]